MERKNVAVRTVSIATSRHDSLIHSSANTSRDRSDFLHVFVERRLADSARPHESSRPGATLGLHSYNFDSSNPLVSPRAIHHHKYDT